MPKVKRTTGIPKSFLKTIAAPAHATRATTLLVDEAGGVVVAEPNASEWAKYSTVKAGSTVTDVAALVARAGERVPPRLRCGLCTQLFREAVTTPCCATSYCDDCTSA